MGAETPPKSSSSDSKIFPPGFRFHPTDEELVAYYLKRKICRRKLKPDMIAETDVYKWTPDELPGLSKLKTGDRQWFFLSPRDRKYPNGGRFHRATKHGYWKASGKDRTIECNSRSVGLKKTLVYYEGRAPNGKRTDWVMYEYTLDEEELKRCPSEHDCYLLYKVFMKSGPGPKNGEQYGAPFREEDWADDDCVGFSGFLEQEDIMKEVDVSPVNNILEQENIVKEVNVSPVNNNIVSSVPQEQDDIDEFLKKIADDPVFADEAVFVQPLTVDYSYTFDEVIAEKENGCMLVNQCSGDVSLPDRNVVPHHYQHSNVQASFVQPQSLKSQLPGEAPELVASATKDCEQGLGGILFEDFLEMDDLLGPEPNVENSEKLPETPLSNGMDGLAEENQFNDVAMNLGDNGDLGQGGLEPFLHPYLPNNLDIGISNAASHSYPNVVENEATDHHAHQCHNEANQTSFQFWAPEAVSEPIPGGQCNGEGSSLPTEAIQNQFCTDDDGSDSWFSTALWSFVDSIPTTPASASENALVNKAFEQMSSFGRVKAKTAAGNPTTCGRRVQKFKGGMFSFSVIGVVCALLWVFIGVSVKLFEGHISS
ncbi:NAC domain-containing protein [Heracleum sosnowskyi]|uniref:NAC domain-containing protein n=1 Tax=Heracleum sosnowskyi TaxID=360622 RepID=A0AAD8IYC3_9APIA|nr:NAC domain-containing protein [Heracleum sosnowskyi]